MLLLWLMLCRAIQVTLLGVLCLYLLFGLWLPYSDRDCDDKLVIVDIERTPENSARQSAAVSNISVTSEKG